MSRAPDAPARLTLHEHGEAQPASGNHPFLLDSSDAVWIVESGRVEIFAIEVRDGRATGARSHYLTVDEGEAFFGMDLARYGVDAGFLAVGKMGTMLRRLSLGELREMAASGLYRDEIADLLDRWVGGLSERLTREIIPGPRVDVSLAPGERRSLEGAQRARSAKGVVWLELERSDLLFLDMEAVSLPPEGFFPLSPDTWLEVGAQADEEVPVAVHPTLEALPRTALWEGLRQFHEILCRCEFVNKRLALIDEFYRLKTRAEYSRAARQAALSQLASVLEEKVDEEEEGDRELDSGSMLRALGVIGREQGIQIKPHPELSDDLAYDEQLTAIARASNIRVRQVALRDEWWSLDEGPILGFWEESGEPVALLPRGPSSYRYVDPANGDSGAVDEDLALRLSAFGQVLYRPFPDGEMSVAALLRFGVKGLSRDLWMVMAVGVAVGILGAVTPYFTGRVFDSAIPQAERGLLIQFVLGLAAVAVGSTAFRLTQSVAVLRIQGKMDYSIQAALWDRMLDLPSTFFRRYSAGDLADRASGISAIRNLLAGGAVSSILGSFNAVFYFALMFWYSARLAGLALVLTLVFVGFTSTANYLQLRYQRREFAIRGRITGLVLQLVGGVGKLRVSGAEDHAFRVWAQQFSRQRRISFRIGRIQNSVAVFNSAFPVFSSMAIFGALAMIQSQMQGAAMPAPLSTGEFIAFSTAFGLFVAAMQSMSDASMSLLRMVPIYERLKPILVTPAEIDETKAYPGKLKGEIELSHLHFRYDEDGPWIIRDVSLRIRPGEFVAFVGPSGSGKSTMMRLMLGFEFPEKGSVYFDGQDLGNLDLRQLRQQLGVVMQESKLLPASIFLNIVGATHRTEAEAWEAARMAGLEEDIREMPMGMHTYLSEGGGGLSGGQRQRLLIARSVVNKPRILFMDEATSALDNRSQAVVAESLDRLQATRIVIAHRLSTVANADRICYLDGGVLRETGSYRELMERDGLFAALAKRQMA